MNHQSIRHSFVFFRRWPVLLLVGAVLGSSGCKPKGDGGGAEETLKGPATVEQATRVIDFTTFPLMEGAAPNPNRAVATLNYTVPKANVKSAFEFQRQKLTAQGWKQSAHDTSVTDQSASTTFKRNGFVLSVSAFPGGGDGITISLVNHGNINFSKLPRPSGTKPVYVGDSATMYVTDAAVASTAAECRKLLLADGWVPYGTAGDSAWFKQNAVRLIVTVSSAPAQGGKTMISFGSELMSADLPAPEQAGDLRYSDQTKELSFDTTETKEAVTDFYKRTLGKAQWEPTLDKTVDIDDRPTMIFRNPAKDMLTLSFSPRVRDGKTSVSLQHQSAAEIAELERRIKAEAPRLKAEMQRREAEESARFAEAHKPLPKIPVGLPAGAKDVEQSPSEIKFTVGNGKAKAIVESWRKQFREAGWKEDVATLEGMAGAVSLSKDKQSLTIHYTDTGFMPAEVNLSAMGAELESSAEGKP
jgi:hypothetical protein